MKKLSTIILVFVVWTNLFGCNLRSLKESASINLPDKTNALLKPTQKDQIQENILKMIPLGTKKINILKLETAKDIGEENRARLEELSDKFLANTVEDKILGFEIIKKIREGENVQYRPEFGISKEEYNEIIQLQRLASSAKYKSKYVKDREGKIEISHIDNQLVIKSIENLDSISEIWINFGDNTVQVDVEKLTIYEEQNSNTNDGANSTAYVWCNKDFKKVVKPEELLNSTSLTIGNQVESGDTMILFYSPTKSEIFTITK